MNRPKARALGKQTINRRRSSTRPMALFSHLLLTSLAALTTLFYVALAPDQNGPLPAREGPPLSSATVWGYQLQNARARAIPEAVDLLVVDFARDGRSSLRPQDVAMLKRRANGQPRIVLAYMSVGEAESYRHYWRSTWAISPPSFLGDENPRWKGNYKVRYWDPAWQRLFVKPDPSETLQDKAAAVLGLADKPYVDRIIDAGFDGVYLDRVDAYDTAIDGRSTARQDMTAFVRRISEHAKRRRPGFLVVPQNGEELLTIAGYREAIDGIAKEDLLYGMPSEGMRNAESDVTASVRLLDRVRREGKPVFVVEYLSDAAERARAHGDLKQLGYRATFATRALDRPPEVPPQQATGVAGDGETRSASN